MSSALAQQKKMVEQLRVECNMARLPMTESIKEFIAFTEQLKEQDPLIIGVDKKTNPYMVKNSCSILWAVDMPQWSPWIWKGVSATKVADTPFHIQGDVRATTHTTELLHLHVSLFLCIIQRTYTYIWLVSL